MNYQHVQTAETADVIRIKEGRLARYNQARQPSSSTARGAERAPALPSRRPGGSEQGRQSLPAAKAPPAGGRREVGPAARAPPARHGGGAAVPLGLRGADRAAAPPAQRVLPGAGGARPPPAAALAQRRHLRRLAGGLRALRAQRGTGPAAALGPSAARPRRPLRSSALVPLSHRGNQGSPAG